MSQNPQKRPTLHIKDIQRDQQKRTSKETYKREPAFQKRRYKRTTKETHYLQTRHKERPTKETYKRDLPREPAFQKRRYARNTKEIHYLHKRHKRYKRDLHKRTTKGTCIPKETFHTELFVRSHTLYFLRHRIICLLFFCLSFFLSILAIRSSARDEIPREVLP